MGQINNKKLLKKLREETKVLNSDSFPTQLAEKIVPVVIAEEIKEVRVTGATVSDATTGTLLTASTIKRTFLVGLELSYAKDVNYTATFCRVIANVKNSGSVGAYLCYMRFEPLTAGSNSIYLSFPFPVEIEVGSVVSVGIGTNVASIDVTACLYYYEID